MRKAVTKLIGKLKPHDYPSFRIDHGSVEDFYIALDDPHKHFAAGEEISGLVILLSKKNLANIVITFTLCGYVKINASPQSKLRSMKHVLFNHTIKIYGPDLNQLSAADGDPTGDTPAPRLVNGLEKGEHRFPFVVRLPHRKIYTSLDFGKGAILYVLRTNLSTVESALSSLKSKAASPGGTGGDTSMALMKSLAKLHHPSYSYEKTINLISPVDVAMHSKPKQKRLTITDPKRSRHAKVHSSSCTINTAATVSSNNSDVDSSRITNPAASSPNSVGVASPNLPETPHNNIQVVMEVAHAGFLRGELIPIKLFINHSKKIQDTRGIIVTLVRVCKIDYGPDGSYESFRKDLQQLVIPLYVDPVTLSLEISTSLRVPADAFPTISGCPMVSFQYFIEVMLNLSGKTLSLEAPPEQPKSSMVPHEELQGASPGTPSGGSFNFHSYAQSRSEYINTDKYKRLKKFLQVTTEIVIGTFRLDKSNPSTSVSDASVSSTRRSSMSSNALSHGQASSSALLSTNPNMNYRTVQQAHIAAVHELQEAHDFSTPPYTNNRPEVGGASPRHPAIQGQVAGVPAYNEIVVPSPDLNPNILEKQHMLRLEASLLPSEPNFDDDSGDSDADAAVPQQIDLGQPELASLPNVGSLHYFHLPSEQDELYELPDIHEGIGLEGHKDYVPNYSEAANDQLVDQHRVPSDTNS